MSASACPNVFKSPPWGIRPRRRAVEASEPWGKKENTEVGQMRPQDLGRETPPPFVPPLSSKGASSVRPSSDHILLPNLAKRVVGPPRFEFLGVESLKFGRARPATDNNDILRLEIIEENRRLRRKDQLRSRARRLCDSDRTSSAAGCNPSSGSSRAINSGKLSSGWRRSVARAMKRNEPSES